MWLVCVERNDNNTISVSLFVNSSHHDYTLKLGGGLTIGSDLEAEVTVLNNNYKHLKSLEHTLDKYLEGDIVSLPRPL